MFNFFRKLDYIAEIERLQGENNKLSQENCELRQVINSMKSDFASHKKKQIEEASQCDFEIDFEGAQIASVERIVDDGVEKTSFGRLNGKGGIHCDFVFYCSRERHNEIVKKFREYMKGKNNGANATVLPTQQKE